MTARQRVALPSNRELAPCATPGLFTCTSATIPPPPGSCTPTGGITLQPGAGTLRNAGAVYLYQRHDTAAPWQRQAYIKALQPQQNHEFGSAVALDASGTRLAVSEQFANNSLTGIQASADVVDPLVDGQNGAV